MKIERLPSGTYRVRKTVDKKTHSFYFDEKPTKKMGIPMFSVHALRHYFASKLFYLGYSKREIEILGGWEKGRQALEMIYTQSMLANSAAGRKQIMDSFAQDLFV